MERKEWRPKWGTIPSDEFESHFTDIELASMKVMETLAVNQSWRSNNSIYQEIVAESPCAMYSQITPGSGDAKFLCCLGTFTLYAHGNTYLPGWTDCHKHRYDVRMDFYRQHRPLMTHDLFWSLPNESSIHMIGDSISHQMHDAFVCDVSRNNELHREDDIQIEFVQRPHGIGDDGRARSETFISNRSGDGQPQIVHLTHWRHYTAELELYNETLCELSNVVLLNFGVHFHLNGPKETDGNLTWNEAVDGIFRILQHCFDRYESLEKKPVFIWAEATAQHFGGRPGGLHKTEKMYPGNSTELEQEFRAKISGEEQDPELLTNDAKWAAFGKGSCSPHRYLRNETNERHMKRQAIVEGVQSNHNVTFNLEMVYPDRAIEGQRNNTLYFIPLKDVTDPLWDLHKDCGGGDCTHWCHTPFMWEFVWDSVAKIVDKNEE